MSEQKKVITAGVWDLGLHLGHLNILTKASEFGPLTVCVMSDHSVLVTKGRKPVLSQGERMKQIAMLPFVKEVKLYSDYVEMLAFYGDKIEVIVQGDDWLHSANRTREMELIREHGIRLILLPRTEGISSGEIRKRIERTEAGVYVTEITKEFLRPHFGFLPDSIGERTIITETPNEQEKLPPTYNLEYLEISQISHYEKFDEKRKERIKQDIVRTGILRHPVVVASWRELKMLILIDGVNREQAVRELGATHIPAIVWNYDDIELRRNGFLEKDNTRISEMPHYKEHGRNVVWHPLYAKHDIARICAIGQSHNYLSSGSTWHVPPLHVLDINMPLEQLIAGKIPRSHTDMKIGRYCQGPVAFYE